MTEELCNQRFTLMLTENQLRQMQVEAERLQRSVGWFIREACAEKLARIRRQPKTNDNDKEQK